jgi:TonB family protein
LAEGEKELRRPISSLILASLIFSAIPARAAVSSNTLVCIGNYGNKLLSQKKDIEAVALLEQMFKRQPDYPLSRKNLAIAYNNLAVDHPKSDESYAAIHKSLALNLDDAHAIQALDWILEEKGVDASTDAARVKYADKLKEKGDDFDAFVEYSIANKKSGDAAVQKKIDELSSAEDKTQASSLGSLGAVLLLKKIEIDHSKDALFGFEYEPYTREINRRVTKFWKPPASIGNRQVQVAFDTSPNGSVSNLKIVKSSGDLSSDALALSAVKNASPFQPNASEIPFDVPITIQLDNLGDNSKPPQ